MGELTISNKSELVSVALNQGLETMIKPLVKEIHLFDTYVAGTAHLKDSSILGEIKAGDKLILRREENKFDSKSIVILSSDGKKLGYVPEKDNVIFSRLMDAGKMLSATITEIRERSGNFKQISIGIFLVDF